MRSAGINDNTGFPGAKIPRRSFDPETVRREMQIIAGDLHCGAVRISGGDPVRLTIRKRRRHRPGSMDRAVPREMTHTQMSPFVTHSAEHQRRGAKIVLVAGCELSLFAAGFVSGEEVCARVAAATSEDLEQWASLRDVPARLNVFLADTVTRARERLGGELTYSSLLYEDLNWGPFDIVALDAYRDADNAGSYRRGLRRRVAYGKPVAVAEFGCCTFQRAADDRGTGWAIADEQAEPPRLTGDYVKDEADQVRYLRELLAVFEEQAVGSAFWFTFAGYSFPHCSPQ